MIPKDRQGPKKRTQACRVRHPSETRKSCVQERGREAWEREGQLRQRRLVEGIELLQSSQDKSEESRGQESSSKWMGTFSLNWQGPISPATDGRGWAVKAVKAMPVGIEPYVLSFMTSLTKFKWKVIMHN